MFVSIAHHQTLSPWNTFVLRNTFIPPTNSLCKKTLSQTTPLFKVKELSDPQPSLANKNFYIFTAANNTLHPSSLSCFTFNPLSVYYHVTLQTLIFKMDLINVRHGAKTQEPGVDRDRDLASTSKLLIASVCGLTAASHLLCRPSEVWRFVSYYFCLPVQSCESTMSRESQAPHTKSVMNISRTLHHLSRDWWTLSCPPDTLF